MFTNYFKIISQKHLTRISFCFYICINNNKGMYLLLVSLKHMTLTQILKESPTKELLRAIKSNKSYCKFKISVFNVGVTINIINTDTYKEINPNYWNGYDFIIENDYTTKYYITRELSNRELTKNQKRGLIYYN